MSDMIFVDSNVFVAFYNVWDTQHKEAVAVITKLSEQPAKLVVSNLVFSEIVTVLSMKLARSVAVEAGNQLLNHPNILLLYADVIIQRTAWQIFRDIKGKNISFVDAAIIAMLQAESIPTLLSFDIKDFKPLQKRYGFKLL